MHPDHRALWSSAAAALTALALVAPGHLHAQEAPAAPAIPAAAPTDGSPQAIAAAIDRGIDILLKLQEPGEPATGADAEPCQWHYEGVYRVRGKIPVGYRIGGTALSILAIAQSPRYATDAACKAAVERGVGYLTRAIEEKDMSTDDYTGGYDVRIWGDIEGLWCLCRLKRLHLMPESQAKAADAAIDFYLRGVIALEMPATGGWNYARPQGKDAVGAPSCFVTSAALQALYEAEAAGYEVPDAVIERGLAFLAKARGVAGNFVYSGEASERTARSDATPGATGRMTQAETTLALAGRGSLVNVRGSIDAFIVHWEWLNKRRAKGGTHQPPYMVAPYYFMFAHHYAAQAIEMLPAPERGEYRRRVNELLMSVRGEDGSWNDRVFPRSAGYGTAMALLAMMQPTLERPTWSPSPKQAP